MARYPARPVKNPLAGAELEAGGTRDAEQKGESKPRPMVEMRTQERLETPSCQVVREVK
jgi:hypothetical protein